MNKRMLALSCAWIATGLVAACGDDETTDTVVEPTCFDFERNGDETDVDCGGSACEPCAEGLACDGNEDCETLACLDGTCGRARCNDDVLNGGETDVDCGGPDCLPCPADGACRTGRDCLTLSCARPDGSDVGSCVDPCTDGRISAGERGIDCGGVCLARCPDGTGCESADECTSGVCEGYLCQAPACDDLVLNGDESDRDCGGLSCPGCDPGRACRNGADCASQICQDDLTCAVPACDDGFQNGDETDVDCGGSCGPCPDGAACLAGGDCRSRVCDGEALVCLEATCEDGVVNGRETDVDCGGRTCGACGDGRACVSGVDCLTGTCFAGYCGTPVFSEFGRDAFGYVGESYEWRGSPCPDIRNTGVALPVGDDGTAEFSLPFDFEFYGGTYSRLFVNGNGTAWVDPSASMSSVSPYYACNFRTSYYGTYQPSSGPWMAPWMTYLNPDPEDVSGADGEGTVGVWAQVVGSEPNRKAVVQWRATYDSSFYTDPVDFRMTIEEGSNVISFCYADTGIGVTSYDNAGYSVVGIRGSSSNYVEYSCYTYPGSLTAGTILRFTPPD